MDALRKIDLNLLLALHALLIEKHVTRAAVRLHRSQPAVSHALAQLREYFDDPLLVRQGGKMILTARAQSLVTPLQDALGSLNGLLASPDFDPATAQRRFRLSLSDYASRIILPPLVKHLRQTAPGIDLAISQSSREGMMAQLQDGELDLALGIFTDVAPDISVQTLFVEDFICVADRHSLPQEGCLSLNAWLARSHVMVAMRPDAYDEIERALGVRGLERRIALALPHWGAAVDVLPGTDLVLTVASRAADSVDRHRQLARFAPPFTIPQMDYQQAWHSRKEHDPAHRWLREVLFMCSQP
ncbi:PCP degradation transcriptional activation protein [Pseudomonas sp. MM227]|uniref:LysR family transcriptional regulator n=1 Tax=unclassified Pseudomonas TaxID=196821 RepID=UPI00177AEE36|nr:MULTISPECIES: LysR family transcriptional regulator [unclassified Pseudomonas]MBD8730410.1 LysR family transcriptional regulator [Pseudomonas sp. CFBP 13710]CAI3788822.1 PCP degradation transcriptional activation protein [Pseudomonas sp. MM227]